MLGILGSPKRLCDGATRRDFLQVGGLSALISMSRLPLSLRCFR